MGILSEMFKIPRSREVTQEKSSEGRKHRTGFFNVRARRSYVGLAGGKQGKQGICRVLGRGSTYN